MQTQSPILIIAANGKTGRRVTQRLREQGRAVRAASRSGEVRFDWNDPATWPAAVRGVDAVYVVYTPDLAVPAAPAAIAAFTELARQQGVRRLVLLSGRGEEEARRCERIVQDSGLAWTIVRASWFAQNFDEGAFLPQVLGGQVALPAGDVREPFLDIDDLADVVVAALTEDGHTGEVYELTGPRLMTFAEAVGEIAAATGREIGYQVIPGDAFTEGLGQAGLPREMVDLLDYLFTEVLDGRNAHLADGVQRALGRAPRDFRDYARGAAATGAWEPIPDRARAASLI